MSDNDERMIGMILYTAISPDYLLRSIVFTDKRVIEIPLSKLSEFIGRAGQIPSVAAFLLEAANPGMFVGLGTIVGVKMWKNLKKNTEGKKSVVVTDVPLSQQMATLGIRELPYEKINVVKIKKVPLSEDAYLNLGAGFIHSKNIVFKGNEIDDVRGLIERTPLSLKIQQ
ncbi:MAG: hypothetical protein AMDU3_IPLC00004G0163 [Thermoplasmatales archaeon I-plasma]|jgi:hypothetical protein|nr:MAG: hypothetical protein AMDU3_IPLC00004G0163 [Thermoplasmatales archaeon I-plasma]